MTKAEEIREIVIRPITEGKMTIAQFSRKTGILPRTINFWTLKQRCPSLNQADKALKTFGVKVEIGGEKDD